ncbi:Mic1 domain-containing protein [Entamoeba marina]
MPVGEFARIVITSDLVLVMNSGMGILYELQKDLTKVAVVKVPPFSMSDLKFNQNQFINFNEQTITTLKADFSLLSQHLSHTERCSFLHRHSAPQYVQQKVITGILNEYEQKLIDVEIIRKIFTISSNYEAIFSSLVNWKPSPPVFNYIVLEYISSSKTKIPPSLFCRLIKSLIDDEQFSRLLMMLQSHVIPDDEVVALYLVSMKERCDFVYQFAMDMFKRMKKNKEQIFEILLSQKEYAEALMFCFKENVNLTKEVAVLIIPEIKNPVLSFQVNQFLENNN